MEKKEKQQLAKKIITIIFISVFCFLAVKENTFATTSNNVLVADSVPTITVENVGTGINITWNKVDGATSYKIYRKTNLGSYFLLKSVSNSNILSYIDNSAKEGIVYTYTVKAVKNNQEVSSVAKSIIRLSQPKITAITNNANSPTLQWEAQTNIDGYKIYRKTVNGTYCLIGTISNEKTTTFTDTTAQTNTLYSYAIRSYKGNSTSAYNIYKNNIFLKQPEMTNIINTGNGVELTWTKITGATGYKIYRKTPGGTYSCLTTVSSNNLSYIDKNVISGKTYIYTVRAINGSYLSAYTKYKTEMFLKQPDIEITTTETEITISWTGLKEATAYKVYRKTLGGTYSCIATLSNNTTTYTDKNVEKNNIYYYTVRTINGSYLSAYNQYKTASVLGHTLKEVKEVTPTCTENGHIKYYKCDTCSKLFKDSSGITEIKLENTIIKATGHKYESEVTKEATCTEEGVKTYTCSVCGDSYTEVIEKTEHQSSDWIVEKESTENEEGLKIKVCTICDAVIESEIIPKIETPDETNEYLVADFVVKDGNVIDSINNSTINGSVVNGEYFTGGTITLPSNYTAATIEVVMDYNRESSDLPIGNGLSYYGGTFKLLEVDDIANLGLIKTPFGGGQITTDYILHPSINYRNKKILNDGDSFWALTFDSSSSTYALQLNSSYIEKAHWSNYINKSFTISSEHNFKEIKIYSRKLTEDELNKHFINANINEVNKDTVIIGRITNGLTDLGSATAFKKTQYGYPEWYETNTTTGNYTVEDGNGLNINYDIIDYIAPDNGIDNSQYESVHIINSPDTLYVDYKYALSAVPYPFNVNHNGESDQYDVMWEVSDSNIASIIDGLLIPKKTGTITVTAILTGTDITDTCTIEIIEKETIADKIFNVPINYISSNGYSFSDTDYENTTHAIYDAIDEAYEKGYNHVIFPEIDFYVVPISEEAYYIPTGMTVEFPEGSTFHMMENDYGKNNGYTFFRMGWDWYDYNIPTSKAYIEKDDNGNILGYYCNNAHLIIDKYYGEFYEEGADIATLNTGANEYNWSCVLLNIGRKAQYCTVEVHEAQCPTGFFIVMGGKVGAQALADPNAVKVKGTDFISGWLNDDGEIEENENWISTNKFFTVSDGLYGYDTLHEYFFGDWEENVTTATQHLYDVLWFDEDYKLIEADRWQYVDEKYIKPDNAKYFKISIQQSELPTTSDEYIRLHPDASSKFCEIKNTKVINGADGLASIIGATSYCWIHDNYISNDGLLTGSCWELDIEDGWQGMRGTVIEHNIFRKYAYSATVGEYTGMDSGILALSSGYNTFVISNYIGAIAQSNSNVVNTHIINNSIYTMYSSISSAKATNIKAKIYAHVYYNNIADSSILENTTANGKVYNYNNNYISGINKW